MTDFENMEAVELNAEEMNEVAGGAFKALPAKTGFIVYRIQKGENLTRIAKKYKCTVSQLLSWNPKITDKNIIYAGDYIYVKA